MVGRLGVAKFNPMVFALIREVVAGFLLLLWALYKDGPVTPRRRDALLFLSCGFFIFTNQAAFIIGDKLAGAVLGSAWQPTQPVFTLLISIALRWEQCTFGKAAGILISFGGAALMVTYGQTLSGGVSATRDVVGNLLFFANCLGTSGYVIVVKLALARGYPPSTVTAWSYLCGACMMACVATGFSSNCELVNFVCPAPAGGGSVGDLPSYTCGAYENSCEPWAVPPSAVLPLCYWIAFNSCVAYLLMTWANKHVNSSVTSVYTVLQPLTSAVLSTILLIVLPTWAKSKGLIMPGLNALGIIGIVIGLAVVLYANQAEKTRKKKKKLASEKERALLDHASA